MKPTVGRIVHYFPPPQPPAVAAEAPLAAIVTSVYPELPDVVNLHVFSADAHRAFGASGVTRRGGQPASPDSWDWPPRTEPAAAPKGEPTTLEEYLARFSANQRLEGHGFRTTAVVPCPFCAAADFLRYRILDVEAVLSAGATCPECGRAAKALFNKASGETRFEIVQTDGPDQPAWLLPPMRRLEETER